VSASRVRELLERGEAGAEVEAAGWLRSARHAKELSFLDLSDGSCLAGLQVVAGPELANYESELRQLGTGCAVRASGVLVASPAAGQRVELRATRVELVGDVAPDYPLQKKRHSFEFLRTIAHLRPRTNTIGAVLRVRNVAARAIHDFFQQRGFVWLHAPILTAADAEGAGAMFEVAGSAEFFGKTARLTVSGQLEAEIGALALTNVYSFGPTFRAENSNTSRHLSEFWMIEPEIAFGDLADNAQLAEDLLKYLFDDLLTRRPDDMAFFDLRIEKGVVDRLKHVIRAPFRRLSYTDAVEILQKSGRPFEFPVEWGTDLQSEHERFLTEEHFKQPVILTDYPKQIKAFYMRMNDDGKTVAAMDVLVPKIGEIIGGSQREERLEALDRRIDEMGLRKPDYWWYRDLRRFGTVPHAGFGLGFERLVQFCTGMTNIRDVIPFPRAPRQADF